jgi:hypothetical protein
MKRRHSCSRDQDEPLRADYYSAYAAYGAEGMSALRQKSTFDRLSKIQQKLSRNSLKETLLITSQQV